MVFRLTRVFSVLTDEAKKGLHKEFLKNQNFEELTDEDGHTADYYENMNIPIPEELKGTYNKGKMLKFTEKDVVRKKRIILIDFERVNYEFIESNQEGGSIIFYPSGAEIVVEESIEKIEKMINIKIQQ